MNLLEKLLYKILTKLRNFGEVLFLAGLVSLIYAVSEDLSMWFIVLAFIMIEIGLEARIYRSEDMLRNYMDSNLKRLESEIKDIKSESLESKIKDISKKYNNNSD